MQKNDVGTVIMRRDSCENAPSDELPAPRTSRDVHHLTSDEETSIYVDQ
jgi:hypothetical protein